MIDIEARKKEDKRVLYEALVGTQNPLRFEIQGVINTAYEEIEKGVIGHHEYQSQLLEIIADIQLRTLEKLEEHLEYVKALQADTPC